MSSPTAFANSLPFGSGRREAQAWRRGESRLLRSDAGTMPRIQVGELLVLLLVDLVEVGAVGVERLVPPGLVALEVLGVHAARLGQLGVVVAARGELLELRRIEHGRVRRGSTHRAPVL